MTPQEPLPPGYPTSWEADVVLADGSVAWVRPIKPSDAEGVHRFHSGQSKESVYFRFFAPIPRLSDRDVRRFTNVDYNERVALVLMIRGDIAGIGRFDRLEGPTSTTAEVAFNVSDAHQGRGVGSVLLEHLADIGRQLAIRRFVADVLPSNRKMIRVFKDAGYEIEQAFDDGVLGVSFDIEPTDASRAVLMSREHRAESVSVRRVLSPTSVAIIGASRDQGAVGRATLDHIVGGDFAGEVFVVNPQAEESIAGLPAYDNVTDIDAPIDLAVIAVPAVAVNEIMAQCADAQVGAVMVVSSGFAEAGPEGEERQRDLLRIARASGMRVLGPNSFGMINNDPQVRLNASLASDIPDAGGLGLFAQSGALSIAVLSSAHRRGLGISTFASAGNRVDISGNDLMQYWLDDDATSVVGLYLESMGNPRKFSRIARKLATTKPVIVVKSGVSEHSVPPGHTVRITRERPEVFGSMLRQAGVIRVENTHQMFDVAQLVLHQPLPKGPRVAIVTNSDALGSLAADSCVAWSLQVMEPPTILPAWAEPEAFADAVRDALENPEVDSVVASFIPPAALIDPEIIDAVQETSDQYDKPCVATFVGMRGGNERGSLPVYSMPEDAIRSLAAATRYADWKERPYGVRARPSGINRREAQNVVESFLAANPGGGVLNQRDASQLLAAYGIEVWESRTVGSPEEAAQASREIGGMVVVKATSDVVSHQPGERWVRTRVSDSREAAKAYRAIAAQLSEIGLDGVAVQAHAPTGVSVEITSVEDPLFGPVVGFGIAGLPSELMGDVAHRFPPLTNLDIEDMVTAVRAAPLLDGYRGTMPVDHSALYDLLGRVSVMAEDLPEMALLRLNPVQVHQEGSAVLGAHIRLERGGQRSDTNRRALIT